MTIHKVHIYSIRLAIFFLVIIPSLVNGQDAKTNYQNDIFWTVRNAESIRWDLTDEVRLPHSDHIEMSGQYVSAIIDYQIDEKKNVHVSRDILFPQLRRYLKINDPDYLKYRAYLRDKYTDTILPVITIGQNRFVLGSVDSVVINGKLNFYHHALSGLQVKRTFYPSMNSRVMVEKWTITNVSDSVKKINIGNTRFQQQETGSKGHYTRTIFSDALSEVLLSQNQSYSFGIYFTATLNDEEMQATTLAKTEQSRNSFLDTVKQSLVLITPDAELNTLFYFSKIRAAESIFDTKLGLVHSPGGGSYYTGIWANDQAEYSGPFFPYLNYKTGTIAALNAYRTFLKNIPKDDGKMWASFEMEGDLPCCSKDRGDAAMIAFGATQFCLASGKKEYAETLWPLIEWCIAYSEKMKNSQGVIASDSDELEGRFPTGTANLSTSSLHYGALIQAAYLAKALGKSPRLVRKYNTLAKSLSLSIEQYFGATVQGMHTYKYYAENKTLRSWISMPLVVGIDDRAQGTLDALFNKLWSDNGVLTELNPEASKPAVFWDRGTLYAFRGAFLAGGADRALKKLQSFSKTRLTGFHVPYVVEAWPEGNMAHLSAESALYCRIFTEGILGIQPTGFKSFDMQPHLPSDWDTFEIRNIAAFDTSFDLSIERKGGQLNLSIKENGRSILKKAVKDGELISVNLTR